MSSDERDEQRSEPAAEIDAVDVKDLLRRALRPPARPAASILRGVQRRIRQESGGRFFADGWSTATAPRATFLVTALVMLAVVALAWLWLVPIALEVVPSTPSSAPAPP
ncbi:MAG: hypothetical protein HY744_10040 [Deltaproteobacteria bacterium]|nr:hypothetical protein [Deltaproteobacteria bacterium]